jgi:formate hydrogenlyase subunit 6/NADH:ubiquinone oxidoreductase subunit I
MFREEPNPRKKKPKIVAVIETAGCTGCEVCIDFCPVDCIDILPGPMHRTLNKVCIINEDVCIGCSLCAKYCPWETIDMVSYDPRIQDQEETKKELERELGVEPKPELAEAS